MIPDAPTSAPRPPSAPITLAQVSPEWLALRRDVAMRYGYALRAGEGNSIEFRSQRPDNAWLVLPLPTGAHAFMTAADRDAVLTAILEGA